ncbi:Serine/threonine protein kinase [Plasmodium coatneyi]|uniref:Serine/threonine protein kinase n=1 Tax=Plasmodium coatneyi TaxID=208452 RepID=A0A1B1DXM0_9APIC|nr:Serine/threonine protein kinase [Plasmodium coatneyi]ANQ07357.1 Serine/threonine protein kinase [Plasmodium coatneyi]
MQRIRREDYLSKCKNRDDFVYTHVRDILSHQPFDEILEYQNGDVYIGTTKNKKRHGYGYYIYKEIGSVYEGEWIENAKSGYGTLYNPQGIVYSGEWLNNISHGFGCTYTNEQLFLGTYKFGLINGVGILKKKNSYNFCLFQSNRKKCKIKITKHMDIYLHYYKKDKLFLKENLSAFFPLYTDNTISRLVRKQIFDHLFGVDKSFVQFFANGTENGVRNERGKGSPSGGFLSYVNYESRINFLKGLISKGAKGVGEEGQPDGSVYSTDDSVWNSPPKGETNQRSGCNFFPFHEDMDPRGDSPTREAAKDSTRHHKGNEERCPPFVEASVGSANYLYNTNDSFKCPPHLKLTHLFNKSDSESEFCPDVTPSSASSPEQHFKVKRKVTTPIRSVFHSNGGESQKRIITQKRQGKRRKLKLYKLLVGGCSKLGCDGPKGEGSLSNGPSESTAECRDAQWGSRDSTQCISSKAALYRNTLRGKAIAGPRKEMARMQRQMKRQRRKAPLTTKTPPTVTRLLSYLKYKNEKNKIECIYQWRSYHIFVFLHLFGLHKYIAAFKCNHVNGFHFFTLNRKILRMLGVDKNEYIYFLLNFVNAFSSLHNTYLQMLVSWGSIRGDALVTFSSIPKSELVVLNRLGRRNAGKASYLCYYANGPVRLKMFSGRDRTVERSTRGTSDDERDGLPGDDSPRGASPCDDCTEEGVQVHLGNPLVTAAQKFLFDEQQLSNIGESILDGWASIRSNLVNLEPHEMFKRLKGGDPHPRAQVERNEQKEKSEKQDAQDRPATLIERIQRRTEFMKEHFVLSNLRHPNVIKYIGNVISRKKEKFGLVFEFLSGMSLHDAIYGVGPSCQGQGQTCEGEVVTNGLTNENIIKLFYEIASALFYLHSRRVVHGNISSKNIFVSEDGGSIKLCNFEKASIECYYDYKVNASGEKHLNVSNKRSYGWSRWGDAKKGQSRNSHAGGVCITQGRSKHIRRNHLEGEKMNLPLPYITCMNEAKNINTMMTSPLLLFQAKKFDKRKVRCDDPYAAPEVLREEECTDKCDIYSFGVVIYEVLFGGLPFVSDYMPSFFRLSTCFKQKYIYIDVNKLRGKFPNRKLFHFVVSNVLLVMRQCLNPEPTCRPDSEYLCRHFGRLVGRLR